MGLNWDDKQLKFINDTENNYLISAGAGAGKTTILIEKIKTLVKGMKTKTDSSSDENAKFQKVPLDKILITSYTRKSAADIKLKLREKFISEGMYEELDRISEIYTGTIHSVAINLIKKYYYIIDNLSPNFSIADENNAGALKDEAFNICFKQLKEEKFFEDKKDFQTKYFEYKKGDKDVKDIIKKIDDFENTVADFDEWKNDGEKQVALLWGEERISGFLKKDIQEELDNFVPRIKKDGSIYKDDANKIERLKNEINAQNSVAKNIKKTEPDIKIFLSIYAKFKETFRQYKRHKNVIDFNDAEKLLLEILKNDGAKKQITEMFEYIFIDEYQDVNYTEEKIIQEISGGENSKLICVGDIKQSIYNFKNARVENFIARKKHYESGEWKGVILDQTNNFRSSENIIKGVNLIFEKLLSPEKIEEEQDETNEPYNDEHRLVHKRDDKGEKLASEKVEYIKIKRQEKDNKKNLGKEDIKKFEGQIIAEKIIEYKEKYKLKNSDFAVISRTNKTRINIGNVLRRYDIPTSLNVEANLYKRIEIKVLLEYLKVLDTDYSDVPLITFLKAPIFNFSESDLLTIRNSYKGMADARQESVSSARAEEGAGSDSDEDSSTENYLRNDRLSFYEILKKYKENFKAGDIKEKVDFFFEKLEKLQKDAKGKSLETQIFDFIIDTGYYEYVLLGSNPVQKKYNILSFISYVSSLSENGVKDLFGVIEHFESLKESEAELNTPSFNTSDDIVELLTVHGSKGLEFKVVFVIFSEHPKGVSVDKDEIISHDYGFMLPFYRYEYAKDKSPLIECEKSKRISTGDAEAKRIFYTALTRAMDKLFIVDKPVRTEGDSDKARYFKYKEEINSITNCNPDVFEVLPEIDAAENFEVALREGAFEVEGSTEGETAEGASDGSGSEGRVAKGGTAEGIAEMSADDTTEEEKFEPLINQFKPSQVQKSIERNIEAVKNAEIDRDVENELNEKLKERPATTFRKSKISVSELVYGETYDEPDITDDAEDEVEDRVYNSPEKYEEDGAGGAQVNTEASVATGDKTPDVPNKADKFKAHRNEAIERGNTLHLIFSFLPKAFSDAIYGESGKVSKGGGTIAFSEDFAVKVIDEVLDYIKQHNLIEPENEKFIDKGRIKKFVMSDLFRRVIASNNFRTETPFYFESEYSKEGEDTLIQGIIDLFFFEGGEIVLVDFKSSNKHTDKYYKQLDYYAKALEDAYNVKVSKENRIIWVF